MPILTDFDTPQQYVDQANIAIQQSDWVMLNELASVIRDKFPNWIEGFKFGVLAYKELKDESAMERLLSEAVERFPDNVDFAFNLAIVAKNHQNWAEALKRWDTFCTHFPDKPTGYLGKVDIYQATGDWKNLEILLTDCIIRFPTNVELAVAYSQCAFATKNRSEQKRRWLAVPIEAKEDNYYRQACFILQDSEIDTNDDVIKSCIRALLSQPIEKCGKGSPYIITESYKLSKINETRSKEIHRQVIKCLMEKTPVSTVGELYILAFSVPRPQEELIRIVAKWLLDDSFQRFSHSFGANSLNAKMVPGLVELLLQIGVVASLKPAQIYRIATVLYCVDQEMFEQFVAEVVKERPEEKSLSNIFGILNHVHTARKLLMSHSSTPEIHFNQKRLKIALCISGQLRGFRQALPSWSKLGLDSHEVDTFVHVWSMIGRRFPEVAQAHRVFSGSFLEAYRKVYYAIGQKELMKRYPKFCNFFHEGDVITEDELKTAYRTDQVVVEEDRGDTYKGIHNIIKMHYKIQSCVNMAAQKGKNYDLVIRIRPDLLIEGDGQINWNQILHRSTSEGLIFSDFGPFISNEIVTWEIGDVMPLMIGDLFAVGGPQVMNHYATVYSSNRQVIEEGFYGFPRGYLYHTTLSLLLMFNGIRVEGIKDLIMKHVCDPEPITTHLIFKLLKQDIKEGSEDDYDQLLLKGCETDILSCSLATSKMP
ncbi:MAG: hypothetical protein HQM08_10165 [Candidatus Riflebacteria bacterium]|nr:hypothetical protein [Candidatus Riflebacteria bacterium]